MNSLGGNAELNPAGWESKVFGVEPNSDSLALCVDKLSGIEYDDLYDAWRNWDIPSQTVRQFMVAMLTAPKQSSLPHQTNSGINRLMFIHEDVGGERTRSLRRRLADRPDLAEELASGVLFWLGTDEGMQQAMTPESHGNYRTVTRHLLSLVSEETENRLFEHFITFGDEMLGELVSDQEVTSKYVEASLEELFRRADQELSATVRPRRVLLIPTANGALTLALGNLTSARNVDTALCGRIVTFLEEKTPADRAYMDGLNVSRVAGCITDEQTRYAFMRRHINGKSGLGQLRFRVRNEEDLQLTQWVRMIAQERENDEALLRMVDSVIEEYRVERQRLRDQSMARATIMETFRTAQ
jgi:hypothetical protein